MYTTRSHEPSIDINAPNPAPEPPAAGLRLMHTNRWLHLPDLLEPDRSLTLGRTRQRDLRIDESTVSREHCKIVRTWSNEYILHDCGSKNGLWVSRYGSYSRYERVISIKLTVGMHIRLGKATLIVVDADGAAPHHRPALQRVRDAGVRHLRQRPGSGPPHRPALAIRDPPTHQQPTEPGSIMSTYRLLDRIGHGGMGEVFEAYRILPNGTRSRVACKSMRDELHAHPSYLDMFFREANLNLEISHNHHGLVSVHECIEDTRGRSHLIMELVEGCSLHEIGNAYGPPSWDVLRLVARETLETLAYIHERGIIHRDISPCNILVSRTGEIKLSDLGLAKLVSAGRSDPRRFRGKWPYAAPEAVRGGDIDTRSDLFSFAAIMYELITATSIYRDAEGLADVEAILRDWRAPALADDAPLDLRALIAGFLHKNPTDRRPQTARQALPLLWPFDAEAARARLADMAATIHARKTEQRKRRATERAASGHQGVIIEARQHIDIDAHADTAQDTSRFDPAERVATESAAPPGHTREHLPTSKTRRHSIARVLAVCVLGWLGYQHCAANATPPQPESTASTTAESMPAHEPTPIAEPQTATPDHQHPVTNIPAPDTANTSHEKTQPQKPTKPKQRARRKSATVEARPASAQPSSDRNSRKQFMDIPRKSHL